MKNTLLVFTVCLMLPLVAIAGDHGEGHLQAFLAELDLTEAQEAELKEVVKEHRSEAKKARESMRDSRKELFSLMKTRKATEEEFRSQSKELSKLQSESLVSMYVFAKRLESFLSPEQVDKILLKIKERREEFREKAKEKWSKHRRGKMRDRE